MPSILITGANRGLGLEFCRQYLAEGWLVHACCRKPANANDLIAAGAIGTGQLHIHVMDVGEPEQVEAVAHVLDGRPLDVLLNNAGIADGYGHGAYEKKDDPDIRNYDFDLWAELLRINTIAPTRVAGAFLDNIKVGDQKKIVNISSGLGSITNLSGAGKYGYCSSKAALNMATRGLSEWLKPQGVIIVPIAPGWTRTEMGGPNAMNSVEDAVTGVRQVIASLTLEHTGRAWNFDGTELPW